MQSLEFGNINYTAYHNGRYSCKEYGSGRYIFNVANLIVKIGVYEIGNFFSGRIKSFDAQDEANCKYLKNPFSCRNFKVETCKGHEN